MKVVLCSLAVPWPNRPLLCRFHIDQARAKRRPQVGEFVAERILEGDRGEFGAAEVVGRTRLGGEFQGTGFVESEGGEPVSDR